VSTRAFDRVAAAVDASHYLLTPRAVVTPRDSQGVSDLLAYAATSGDSITFRSGGTSLSGQAVTAGILVDTRTHFRAISVLDDGDRIRLQPGVTVRQANARLLRYGRKLGPDPASEIACTVGGVIANNSSGMACGVEQNSYRTLESAVVVLASGTVLDTGAPDADAVLVAREPELHATICALRDRIAARPDLVREIERQYRGKNTMGYGLNSFLDFDRPADILTHLLVGSEGTLAFVAEATFRTIRLKRFAATTLLVFDDLEAATSCLVELAATAPTTIELMDAASLRVVQRDPQSRGTLPDLVVDRHAALLVEYQANDERELLALTTPAQSAIARFPLAVPPQITTDAAARAALWHMRKGLYATIAGSRPSGTTALLEDIAVPLERLAETCRGLHALFERHGYADAVVFGHAKDGNIHFLVCERFDTAEGVDRYRRFTEDLVDLVLGAGGTLKAEHGTGRIMAPFVRRQFGADLHDVMLEVKAAFDPAGVLGAGVMLTDDPELHLKALKTTPPVEEEVDRCVECGYCEPVCPSKDLTVTPRQRIAVRRAIADAESTGDVALARDLGIAQQYEVIDTCAVDGMCATACPVLIDTGDLVRRLRSERVGPVERAAWSSAGRHWRAATTLASTALSTAASVPPAAITVPNRVARTLLGDDRVPLWSADLPTGGPRRRGAVGGTGSARVVFFPSCVGRMFGPADSSPGVARAFESLVVKAGLEAIRPELIDSLCCGTPWKSKGMTASWIEMADRTVDALWEASRHGELDVVCDNSSCSEGLVAALASAQARRDPRFATVRIVDSVDFAARELLPVLRLSPTITSLALHPTCSSTRAGSNDNLAAIATAVSSSYTVPAEWGCCAFAGDRGLLHPELTASATAREAIEVGVSEHDAFASCNRTCEIGMSRATGQTYRHILELLDEAAI
jgi:D-lactate dehydrogenase